MRTRYLYAIALLPLGVWLPSCDNVTSGQLVDEPGNPVLLKIMVQDERPTGGRGLATDLLDEQAPIACSDTEPCPAGDQYTTPSIAGPACIIPDGQTTGVCPNPLSPKETPPAIGSPIALGGNQIRLVFSKVLATNTEDVTKSMTGALQYALHDPTIVGLFDESGAEVATAKYYDPTGSPTVTSDLILEPFGPAIVLKPMAPLAPGAKYTIKLSPGSIKDRAGQAVLKDVNGDVKTSYDFTMEAFYPIGGSLADLGGELAPNDAVVLALNAWCDATTAKVTVKKGGVVVPTVATDDLGADPTACADNEFPGQFNVIPVDNTGKATNWAEGEYTVEIELASLDNPAALLSTDAFGTDKFTTTFKVSGSATSADEDPYAIENFLLPDDCGSTPTDEDMAMDTGDMAGGADGGTGDM